MNIAIYGAGRFGNYVKNILDSENDIEFKMFIDNYAPTYNRALIVDEDTFLSRYSNLVDCVWVTIMEKKVVENVVSSLLYNGYKSIYVVDPNVFRAKIGLVGKVYSISDIHPEINLVQIPVTEWCNLKCKSCSFGCNLVYDRVPEKLEVVERDLKALKQKFSNICTIALIGGEPLSVANLDEYIYKAKLYFPNTRVSIVTNGLYIPELNRKVIQAMIDTGAYLRVSAYKPTLKIIDEILSFGIQYGIEIKVTEPLDEFEVFLTKTNDDYITAWKNCGSHDCYHLYNHRLYPCPIMPYRFKHKKFLNLEITQEEDIENSEDIFGNKNGWEILAGLKHPFKLCRYCSIYHQYVKWDLSKGDVDKDDWYVK